MDGHDIAPDVERRRVFVPQALGSDEFLRVTWHDGRGLVVFSHWDGDHCVAATPVRASDVEHLAAMMHEAHTSATACDHTWPAPSADSLIVPAAGFALPSERRTA